MTIRAHPIHEVVIRCAASGALEELDAIVKVPVSKGNLPAGTRPIRRSLGLSCLLMPLIGKDPAADDGCVPPQPTSSNIIQLNQRPTRAGQKLVFFVPPRINDLARRFKSPATNMRPDLPKTRATN